MEPSKPKSELLVLVGPTASGKSELALKIAKELKGEIIAADSRTIFKRLDIGTAKPSQKDREEVPHWGLDLVEPGQPFSVANFKPYAEQKIEDIKSRGHLPILVGGSGLYVDSVLFDFTFGPKADHQRRVELESLSLKELQDLIDEKGLAMPINHQNKRHLVRVIELADHLPSANLRPRQDALIIGLLPEDEVLKQRISRRANEMFQKGVLQEATRLFREHPEVEPSTAGIVYKMISDVQSKQLSKEEAIQIYEKLEWQYARRQRTWLRRNKFIHWFKSPEGAEHFILRALNK